MKVEMDKKYRTREGKEVTLITTEGRGEWPILGYVGEDIITASWRASGMCHACHESKHDLVEVREPREWTIQVDADGKVYPDCVLLSTWTHPINGPIETVHVREVLEGEK